MWGSEYYSSYGLSALEKAGLECSRDRTVRIAFDDPLGLYADLCKLQNRYTLQGTYDPKSKMPTLFIDGKNMGTLDKLKINEIKALAEPSPFGKGNQTVYDENVRKASEIKGDRIKLEMGLPYEIQKLAPMGREIEAKLYKLAIYEENGFFAEHSDTQHGDEHIGTLVICLPVPHKGGTFILSDDGNELKLPFDEMIKGGKIPWVAFYTDVKHQVEVVKSGMRMTLQYDLRAVKIGENEVLTLEDRIECARDVGQSKEAYRFLDYNQEVLDSIINKLDQEFSKGKPSEEKPGKAASTSTMTAMKKRDRPDNDEPIQSTSTKQKKETSGDGELDAEPETPEKVKGGLIDVKDKSPEKGEKTPETATSTGKEKTSSGKKVKVGSGDTKAKSKSKNSEEKKSDEKKKSGKKGKKSEDQESSHLNGVAIMLKRRYGAMSLSLDTLKGSDNVLYHALKDHFTVEVKPILLEQSVEDMGEEFEGKPITIVALSGMGKEEDDYSETSEGEIGLHAENKNVPKKSGKQTKEKESKKDMSNKKDKSKEKKDKRVRKVCLVTGFSSKSIQNIANVESEWTGNEAFEEAHVYMHAALFVFPK